VTLDDVYGNMEAAVMSAEASLDHDDITGNEGADREGDDGTEVQEGGEERGPAGGAGEEDAVEDE